MTAGVIVEHNTANITCGFRACVLASKMGAKFSFDTKAVAAEKVRREHRALARALEFDDFYHPIPGDDE